MTVRTFPVCNDFTEVTGRLIQYPPENASRERGALVGIGMAKALKTAKTEIDSRLRRLGLEIA